MSFISAYLKNRRYCTGFYHPCKRQRRRSVFTAALHLTTPKEHFTITENTEKKQAGKREANDSE
ncbi:MAG: hypothetical protein LBH00_00285 [Planctomycetaceae bacterium]|jgi:hypothetical protein|nr:hypothetical protein [Planctomycetaceae bacterium]